MTPYQTHQSQCSGHVTTHSPNGVDTIEECDCGARFLHNPAIGHPVSLDYRPSRRPRQYATSLVDVHTAAIKAGDSVEIIGQLDGRKHCLTPRGFTAFINPTDLR